MIDARTFAAHLAALARLPDPEDRTASRLLGSVVLDWTQLALSADPRFELDATTLSVAGCVALLPAPWIEALRGLRTGLAAHGASGVRLSGVVDRGAVLALFRAVRTLPPDASREDLQRWLIENGAAALEVLPTAPDGPASDRGALLALARAWSSFVAAAEGAGTGVDATIRTFIERAAYAPEALPVVLALEAPRPARRAVCVSAWALAAGLRLGLDRGSLFDLVTAGLAWGALAPGPSAEAVIGAYASRVGATPSLTDARVTLTLWALHPRGPRQPHLFARMLTLADALDARLRADGPLRLAPEDAVARFQSEATSPGDADLVAAFVATVGRWPVGTLALLDTGDLAVVCRGPADPAQPAHPVVRVVVDRGGAVLVGGPLVDLSRPARARARIVASADPARFGIDVTGAVLG